MLVIYWLELTRAITTTGYLYAKYFHSFIDRGGNLVTTKTRPGRFTIQASKREVKLVDKEGKGGISSDGYNIEMNKKGEIRIRKGHQCKTILKEGLVNEKCGHMKNQRFVWIPASLFEGNRGKSRFKKEEDHHKYTKGAIDYKHRKDRHNDLSECSTGTDEDNILRESLRKKIRNRKYHQDNHFKAPSHSIDRQSNRKNKLIYNSDRERNDSDSESSDEYRRNKEYMSLSGNEGINPIDIYAQVFCLEHKNIEECRIFNRIKDEENIDTEKKVNRGHQNEERKFEGTIDEIQHRPRVRGYYAGGIDYDTDCDCKDECLRNPKNGECYYKMEEDGNLRPMKKPCGCRDGKDLCDLFSVIDKLFCEFAFLNDYASFSRLLDGNSRTT